MTTPFSWYILEDFGNPEKQEKEENISEKYKISKCPDCGVPYIFHKGDFTYELIETDPNKHDVDFSCTSCGRKPTTYELLLYLSATLRIENTARY